MKRLSWEVWDAAFQVFVAVIAIYETYRVFIGAPVEGPLEQLVRSGLQVFGIVAIFLGIVWILQYLPASRRPPQ